MGGGGLITGSRERMHTRDLGVCLLAGKGGWDFFEKNSSVQVRDYHTHGDTNNLA